LEGNNQLFRGGDILCELRFYVPNIDEDERDKAAAEVKQSANKEQDDEQSEEEEITAAKLFNDQIIKKAGLGDQAGDMIAHFHDLPLMVPRGKYSL